MQALLQLCFAHSLALRLDSGEAYSWVDCSTELSHLQSLNLWFEKRPVRFLQTSSAPWGPTALSPGRSDMLLTTGLARVSAKCIAPYSFYFSSLQIFHNFRLDNVQQIRKMAPGRPKDCLVL